MADSRRKLTLSVAARARKRAAAKRDPWLDSPEGIAAYRAKRAEAQALANELGFDYGMFVSEPMRMWMHRLLPAKHLRYGDEMRCEVVSPENVDRTQRGHGPSATRPPSVVGPDYHGGPWVGHERALAAHYLWWSEWHCETLRGLTRELTRVVVVARLATASKELASSMRTALQKLRR